MSIQSNFLKGMLTGTGGIILKTILNFMIIPVIIRFLGPEYFGFYMFLISMSELIVSIDLGLMTGLIQRLSSYESLNERAKADEVLYIGQWLYLILAFLLLAFGAILVPGLPHFFHLSGTLKEVSGFAFWLILLEAAITLYGSFYRSVLMAHSNYHVTNVVEILFIILNNVLAFFLLLAGYGLLEILAVRVGLAMILNGWMMRYVLKVEPTLYQIKTQFSFPAIFDLLKVSFHAMLLKVCGMVTSRFSVVIIGTFMGMIPVGIYSVVNRLFGQISFLVVKLVEGIFPIVNRLIAQDRQGDAGIFLLRISSLTSYITIFLMLFFAYFYVVIFSYIGAGKISCHDTLPVLYAMMPFVWSTAMVIPATSFMFANNRYLYQSSTTLVSAFLNLLLSLLWVQPFGLVGVALGTAPQVIAQQAMIIPDACKCLNVSLKEYIQEVYLKNIPAWSSALIIFKCCDLFLNHRLPPLLIFMVSGILGFIFSALFWMLYSASERERTIILEKLSYARFTPRFRNNPGI